ncbi:uncharacterized protein TNCV_1484101 [Trichonephila clavipes]|nr:uncharacterized protein TNCV_1484101 [Trichonephila clavipes]
MGSSPGVIKRLRRGVNVKSIKFLRRCGFDRLQSGCMFECRHLPWFKTVMPVTNCPRVASKSNVIKVSGLKVSKSNGSLIRNDSSEYNKLFIHGLENSPRYFGSCPIGCTCAHYSAVSDDKLVLLISLVKMWMPLQKVQCVLWLTEFKSVTRVQPRVRTEWNVDPPTSNSIHQWERTLKETETLVSQTSFRDRRHC